MKRPWILIAVVFILGTVTAPTLAHDGYAWTVVGDQKGLGMDLHRLYGGVGIYVWGLSEERKSPGPAISETAIDARQSMIAVVHEWEIGQLSVGAGVANVIYSETGKKTEIIGGIPTLVSVTVEKESEVSPIATVRTVWTGGNLFADAQGIASTKGSSWMARAGWNLGSFWAGIGYASGPGDKAIGAPLIFAGASF